MKIFYSMTLAASREQDRIVKNSGLGSLFLYLLLLLGLAACQPANKLESTTFSGPIMGTDFRITVVHKEEIDKDGLFKLIKASMENVNQKMSTYLDESELSQINQAKANSTIQLSAEMNEVLTAAQSVSQLSGGYFDITVGPLVNAWGFGPDGEVNVQPNEANLLAMQEYIGYQKLVLEGGLLRKLDGRVAIDLSAIAKGYAVDQVAEALNAHNKVVGYLVNIGGELRANGRNIDQQLWRVGIERPELLGGISRIVLLDNSAIATSGDYRNYIDIDGRRFSHTINPNLRKPIKHRLALVSVIHHNATAADALATAMMAMGEQRAWEFANSHSLAVYLIIRNGDGSNQVQVTQSFSTSILREG